MQHFQQKKLTNIFLNFIIQKCKKLGRDVLLLVFVNEKKITNFVLSVKLWVKMYFLQDPLKVKKSKVFYGQEPPSGESTTTECAVNYQLLAVITEVVQRELLVVFDHNQLRTMASEKADPIDWSHPQPHWQYPTA